MAFSPPDLAPGSTVADFRVALTRWRELFGKAADGYGLKDEDIVSGPPNDLIDKQAYELLLDLSSIVDPTLPYNGNAQPMLIQIPRDLSIVWVEWYCFTAGKTLTLAVEGVVKASVARVSPAYPARTTLGSPIVCREGDKLEWSVDDTPFAVGQKFIYAVVMDCFIGRLGCKPKE